MAKSLECEEFEPIPREWESEFAFGRRIEWGLWSAVGLAAAFGIACLAAEVVKLFVVP